MQIQKVVKTLAIVFTLLYLFGGILVNISNDLFGQSNIIKTFMAKGITPFVIAFVLWFILGVISTKSATKQAVTTEDIQKLNKVDRVFNWLVIIPSLLFISIFLYAMFTAGFPYALGLFLNPFGGLGQQWVGIQVILFLMRNLVKGRIIRLGIFGI